MGIKASVLLTSSVLSTAILPPNVFALKENSNQPSIPLTILSTFINLRSNFVNDLQRLLSENSEEISRIADMPSVSEVCIKVA